MQRRRKAPNPYPYRWNNAQQREAATSIVRPLAPPHEILVAVRWMRNNELVRPPTNIIHVPDIYIILVYGLQYIPAIGELKVSNIWMVKIQARNRVAEIIPRDLWLTQPFDAEVHTQCVKSRKDNSNER